MILKNLVSVYIKVYIEFLWASEVFGNNFEVSFDISIYTTKTNYKVKLIITKRKYLENRFV